MEAVKASPMLMRPDDVAKALGLGRSKTYELIATGALPSVRIGRAVRVPRAALENWIRTQTRAPESNPR